MSIRVAVAGASGYIGAELIRLLLRHPRVELTAVTSERLAGERLDRAYAHLRGLTDLLFHDLDADWLAGAADVTMLALPHLESQRVVPVLRRHGRRAIDLSADYRLRDANDYVTWYKAAHTDPSAGVVSQGHCRRFPGRRAGLLSCGRHSGHGAAIQSGHGASRRYRCGR